MTEPIAIVRSMDDLYVAMRTRADQLGLSRETIDILAGLGSGHASSLLAPVPLKRLGAHSITRLLGGLGMMLIATEDPEAMRIIAARLASGRIVRRTAFNVRMQKPVVHLKFTRRKYSKMGKKGGKNSRKYMTKKKARTLARKAARARWSKPVVTEITKGARCASRIANNESAASESRAARAPSRGDDRNGSAD